MATTFSLRRLEPGDGPAVSELGEQTPDAGAVAFHSSFHEDPYAALLAIRPSTIGVVAEAPDGSGLAGLGLMSFGTCQYEGELRPFAYLYSLSVHPRYRQMGLGTRLAAWRVEQARERSGDGGVIVAGIQSGNLGSQRTAESWSRQRVDRTQVAVAKTRTAAPRAPSGLEARPAEDADLDEIATAQNAFYAAHNLYSPETPDSLAGWRAEAPFGFRIHDNLVVTDRAGNLVAGLSVTEEGRLISSHVVRIPLALRLADVVLRIMPPGGVLRRVLVTAPWFAPGREDAGAFAWESARWLARDRGTTLMLFFDPQGPLAGTIPLPRFAPSQTGSLVIRGPVQMDESRPIYQPI